MTESDESGTARGDDPSLEGETRWRHVAQRFYEADRDGGLTTTIVYAIADAKDVAPSEVKTPPLYEVVDVAGIEKAFFGLRAEEGSRQGTGTVEFQYTDYLVRVRSEGWVEVYEPRETDHP